MKLRLAISASSVRFVACATGAAARACLLEFCTTVSEFSVFADELLDIHDGAARGAFDIEKMHGTLSNDDLDLEFI